MQKQVKDFTQKHNLNSNETTRYLDLVSEVGELGKEIIKSTNYGKTAFTTNPSIQEEIGDCIFSLLALCNTLGINAQEALNTAIEKYEHRFLQTQTISSGK